VADDGQRGVRGARGLSVSGAIEGTPIRYSRWLVSGADITEGRVGGLFEEGQPSSGDPERVVKTLLAAIDAGDQDTADSLIAEDVCFRFGNHPTVSGKREFIAGRGALRDSIRGFRHEIVWLGEVGVDAVIVELNVIYTLLDGSSVTVPCCDTFRVRDGLIADYRIYIDISPVLKPG
jgi:ketosteroid isomerase-like protein